VAETTDFKSSFFMMLQAKNYQNWPIQKIKVARIFETRCNFNTSYSCALTSAAVLGLPLSWQVLI